MDRFLGGKLGKELGLPELEAKILQMRAITSIVGSGLAAVIAMWIGRRITYFLTSFAALLLSQYIFWFTTPTDGNFLFWVALVGFCNGIFFGWLPFFLPELFETKVRATVAGVSFNFGRIGAAAHPDIGEIKLHLVGDRGAMVVAEARHRRHRSSHPRRARRAGYLRDRARRTGIRQVQESCGS